MNAPLQGFYATFEVAKGCIPNLNISIAEFKLYKIISNRGKTCL